MDPWHLIAIAFAIPFVFMLWHFILHVRDTHKPKRKTKGQALADDIVGKQQDALRVKGFRTGDARDVIE